MKATRVKNAEARLRLGLSCWIKKEDKGYVVVTQNNWKSKSRTGQFTYPEHERLYHNCLGVKVDGHDYEFHNRTAFSIFELFPDEASAEDYINRGFRTEHQVKLDEEKELARLQEIEKAERKLLKKLKAKYES